MSTMGVRKRARRGRTWPGTSILKLLGWFLMLQGLVHLLVPGAQALEVKVRGWSGLVHPAGPLSGPLSGPL